MPPHLPSIAGDLTPGGKHVSATIYISVLRQDWNDLAAAEKTIAKQAILIEEQADEIRRLRHKTDTLHFIRQIIVVVGYAVWNIVHRFKCSNC